MKSFLCRISILLIIMINIISAEELDLKKTVQLVKEQSKELKLAQAELDLADARIKEAWASALPNITTDVNYTRNLKDQFFFINTDGNTGGVPNKFSFTFKNEYSLSAKLEQTIYSFGKVGTALDIAYDYENYSQMSYDYQKQQIISGAKVAFYYALLTRHIYDLSKDSELSAKNNYDETKLKYESGVVSEFDLLQSEVRWRNAIPLTIAAKKNFGTAVNNLKSLINVPIEKDIELNGSLEDTPGLPSAVTSSDVLENRLDYNALLLEGNMRDKNISLEFANHLPTISGNFTYSYSGRSDEFKIENDFDNYILGLSLSIPIFSGGFTSAQVQKARIEYTKIETRIAQAKDRIEVDIQNSELNLKEAYERIQASEKNVSAAQRAFEIAETRVDNGLATQLELKDSRFLLDQAKVNDLTARFDYLRAYFDWQIITGQWEEE